MNAPPLQDWTAEQLAVRELLLDLRRSLSEGQGGPYGDGWGEAHPSALAPPAAAAQEPNAHPGTRNRGHQEQDGHDFEYQGALEGHDYGV